MAPIPTRLSPPKSLHPCAHISTGAVRHNLRVLRSLLPRDVSLSGVVKSDAYGHGMESVSRALAEEGCPFLIVATLEEAVELRHLAIPTDVLIVGPLQPGEAADVVLQDFSVAVGSLEFARALDAAARDQGRKARVHLKIDTGMGRFGFLDEPVCLGMALANLLSLEGLQIDGIMTHFAEAGDGRSDFTSEQARRFRRALRELEARQMRPRWIHAANSGAVLNFPTTAFSMVRVGISLYGALPDGTRNAPPGGLEPAMSLTAPLADLRSVPANTPISYGRTYVTQRPTRLALLPIGYGQGYPRHASGRASVMVRGGRAPILGTVTMDLTVVDVTDIEGVSVGDLALLFGRLGEDLLPVEELAAAADTIPYEILCNVGRSVPRRVVEE